MHQLQFGTFYKKKKKKKESKAQFTPGLKMGMTIAINCYSVDCIVLDQVKYLKKMIRNVIVVYLIFIRGDFMTPRHTLVKLQPKIKEMD